MADGVHPIDRDWFDARLKAAGLSLRKAAAAIGMDPSALSRSLSGKRRLQIAEADRLARVLGVPAALLIDRIGGRAESGAVLGAAEETPPFAYEAGPKREAGGEFARKDVTDKSSFRHHPVFGMWKGIVTLDPNYDYTQPADPDWGKVYND
jgi:transcriptional regulator with XRE-family HTH domain